MLTEGVSKKVLPNGLTVLVKENSAWPVVAIFTYVKAGYFNEPDHLVGISHLIEHMFFKGTKRRGVGQIAIETKTLGGYVNASTIYDHTLYYTVLPSKHLSQGLDIQADALINTLFDPQELRKETEVVIQEAKRKLDMPTAVAREKLFELAFEQHRIRRWRIGTESGLRALTREDYLSFHKNLYRPENVILVVVGDISAQQGFSEIEKYYAEFPTGAVNKEESPPEPEQTRFKYRFMSGEIHQAHLMIGFRAPEIFHPDSYALEILACLLGRGRSSRLFQNVQEKRSLVNSISSSNYALRELGIFMIEASCAAEKIRDAEIAIFEEIGELQKFSFTQEDLEKARTFLESVYVFGLESVAGQANILAEFEAYGDFQLAEKYLQSLYDVTVEDVRTVAQRYLVPANCSLLEYVPESANLEAAAIQSLSARFQDIVAPEAEGSEDKRSRVESGTGSVFSVRSRSADRKEISLHTLENGIKVLVKENHGLPLVSVGVFSQGGRANENSVNAGITSLSLRSTLKGTQHRNAADIATQSERLGSSVHFSNDPDYLSYSMNFLAKHLNAGFEILADVMTSPTFPREEVTKEKEQLLALQRREKDDMLRSPIRLLYSALFGDHPYGLSEIGGEDSISRLDRPEVADWYFDQVAPEHLLVVLVGDVEAKHALDLVGERFGHLESNGRQLNHHGQTWPTEIVEKVEERDKEQTGLALGFAAPRYLEDDYYSLTVLQNVLSGLGGRFFEELRGRQSLAYTVTTFLASRLAGGAFVSYIATSPQKEERAREGLLKEFQKLLDSPIPEDELQRAKEYTVGTKQISLETNRVQMHQYAHTQILGNELYEMDRFAERIARISSDDILEAARKYFDLDRYAIGVVRGKR